MPTGNTFESFPSPIKLCIADFAGPKATVKLAQTNKKLHEELALNDETLILVFICVKLLIDNKDSKAFDKRFFELSAQAFKRFDYIKFMHIEPKLTFEYVQKHDVNLGVLEVLLPKKYLDLSSAPTLNIDRTYTITSANIKGIYNKINFKESENPQMEFAEHYISNSLFNETASKKIAQTNLNSEQKNPLKQSQKSSCVIS